MEETHMTHVPQHLRESVEFAHARIDALQAALAVAISAGKSNMPDGRSAEDFIFHSFQDMDRELVQKWPDIAPAIRARES